MAATKKVGTQLLVSPHTYNWAQALALVRQESMAEVWRAALEAGGLNGLERQHADTLAKLHARISEVMNSGADARTKTEIMTDWAKNGVPT